MRFDRYGADTLFCQLAETRRAQLAVASQNMRRTAPPNRIRRQGKPQIAALISCKPFCGGNPTKSAKTFSSKPTAPETALKILDLRMVSSSVEVLGDPVALICVMTDLVAKVEPCDWKSGAPGQVSTSKTRTLCNNPVRAASSPGVWPSDLAWSGTLRKTADLDFRSDPDLAPGRCFRSGDRTQDLNSDMPAQPFRAPSVILANPLSRSEPGCPIHLPFFLYPQ